MVAELASFVEDSVSTRAPRWIQITTTAVEKRFGDSLERGDGSYSQKLTGLVEPFQVTMDQGPDRRRSFTIHRGAFLLQEEELVQEAPVERPEASPRRILQEEPSKPRDDRTPGRENWTLSHRSCPLPTAESEYSPTPKHRHLYHETERDSLNVAPDPPSGNPGREKVRPSRLLGLLSPSHNDMLEHKEHFSHFWVQLSSLYGKLLIILMITFTLVEVMDTPVKLLSLQGIYLIYLYVGSIAVIICIYIWVLADSCASMHADAEAEPTITTAVIGDAELGGMTLPRFGSLKRAHLSRRQTSGTSFYLRVGALAFGLGTLVFNGLEMAMHSMMEAPCLNDVVFVHPVLHGLFTFLQMHFLFVNSQVLVERFGLVARFGFMHLAATNLALWARLVVWESGNEWTYFVYLAQSAGVVPRSASYDVAVPTPLQLKGFPRSVTDGANFRVQRDLRHVVNTTASALVSPVYHPISDSQIDQVVALHQCLNTNSLGQLWTSSMPFLYPFIVQFSIIAAGVTYVMGRNVGRDRMIKKKSFNKKAFVNNNNNNSNGNCKSMMNCDLESHYLDSQIDCSGASKGLFLGILCLVAGIVAIIIFLVVKDDDGFPAETLFWMLTGTLSGILAVSCIMTVLGLIQVRKLSLSGRLPSTLDSLLSTATLTGVQLYSVCGLVVGATTVAVSANHSREQRQHLMLLVVSCLQLAQSATQSCLIGEALRRTCVTRHQLLTKPCRQVITFLLCSNIALWAFDSFVGQSWLNQELQLRYLGVLAWGVISRISLPLLVFYRFHSGVLLLEVWQRAYRTSRIQDN